MTKKYRFSQLKIPLQWIVEIDEFGNFENSSELRNVVVQLNHLTNGRKTFVREKDTLLNEMWLMEVDEAFIVSCRWSKRGRVAEEKTRYRG